MFCEYVGQRFNKSSGGNLYQGRANGAGKGFMISAGFKTRAININWRRGARIWFERHVYYAPGPTADERGAQLQAQMDQIHQTRLPAATERVRVLEQELNDKVLQARLVPEQTDLLLGTYVCRFSAEQSAAHPQLVGLRARLITAIRHVEDLKAQMKELQREMIAVALGRECLPARILRQR